MLPRVVIGLLGPVLDGRLDATRWATWRPTVSVCQHEDLLIRRFDLILQPRYAALADVVAGDIRAVSPETEVVRHELDWADPWEFEDVFGSLHDFARAYPFDPDREEYLIHITTGTHVAQICLFLLTESRHMPGKLLQTSPPPRRSKSSPGEYRIIDLDLSRYDRLASRFAIEHHESLSFLKSGIDTRNPRFNAIIEQIERVSLRSSAPLLLMGPTGAGKSRLARQIFELKSARKLISGPFVEVNSATLRGDAAMSTLFGHARGAFTGAVSARTGLLRKARGGVLFLDEIGDMGLDEQAMLLHALEEKQFWPVGSDQQVQSDFQLLAGTNRNLHAEVRRGRFRDDLLARISLWTFRLPGLRERREDVEPNIDYELENFSRRTGQHVTFNKEARRLFISFAQSAAAPWTNNFRDLNGAITRMATLAPGGRITVDTVREEFERLKLNWAADGSLDALADTAAAGRTGDGADGSADGWADGRAEFGLDAVESAAMARGAASIIGGGSHPGPVAESVAAAESIMDAGVAALQRLLSADQIAQLDRFDRVQLAEVLSVCSACRTLSEAGRTLFAASRQRRKKTNDADRLRKYLNRFGIQWSDIANSLFS